MALKVPDLGERKLLSILTGDTANWLIKLYKAAHTPQDADTANDYTEADFPGYAAVTPANWANPQTGGDGVTFSTADDAVFRHTGGAPANDIYGYYVVHNGGELLWAEEFVAPQPLVNDGDKITLKPRLTINSKF